MNNKVDKELAVSQLVEEMLQHCCEYLYKSGGMEEKKAVVQAKIKAASIQNDILKACIEDRAKEDTPQIQGGGIRPTNQDAELPLIEEAEIVDNAVSEEEADQFFKDLGGPEKKNDSDESVEDLMNQLAQTQGPGDVLLGFGPGTPNGIIAKGPNDLDDD